MDEARYALQAPLPARAEVVVVGTGFAGLGAAITLRERGHDVLVLERADDVGGTWRDNTYPGCACDVESHLYSFSFAPRADWSRVYSPQAEIHDYLRTVTRGHGLWPAVRLGAELTSASWDDSVGRWQLMTTRGAVQAEVLVVATGALSAPSTPSVPGLDAFDGPVLHTGSWDHGVALEGKRVTVVGTGASAIQVVPALAPVAKHLTVLQRTPAWVVPRLDRAYTQDEKEGFAARPARQRALRRATYWRRELTLPAYLEPGEQELMRSYALGHLQVQVPDPDLRAALTPDYQIGCKRVLLSDDYYPTLGRPDVTLVPHALVEVQPCGTVAADGVVRPADVLVLATGFSVTEPPVAKLLAGRDGRTLAERWDAEGITAYQGLAVSGFPNLFLLAGPNSGIGHTSAIVIMEAQFRQLAEVLRSRRRKRARVLEVTQRAERRWTEEVDLRSAGTVWTSGGCASWYLDRHGRNSTLWPGFTWRYARRLRGLEQSAYTYTR